MAGYFLDSSALVKRYVSEPGSAWVSSLFAPGSSNEIFIAAVTCVEIIAAFTRRARGRTITAADAASACSLFRDDTLLDYQIVEVTEGLIIQAMMLAETHGLRGYDALQLAAGSQVSRLGLANGLPPITFVSADHELNTAASREGLFVDNPNAYP